MDFDLAFKMSPVFLGLIPLTIALVQVAKVYFDEKYTPLLAVVIGLCVSVVATDTTFSQTILAGLIVGTSAAGTYSGVKKSVKKMLG